MPREFKRSDRVASQIKREIADLIRVGVKDPELGMVTVSDAELTKDLSVATIYVSFLLPKITPQKCIKKLQGFAPELRQGLSKRLRIRVLPEIRFSYDDSLERGQRMESLLLGLNQAPIESEGDED